MNLKTMFLGFVFLMFAIFCNTVIFAEPTTVFVYPVLGDGKTIKNNVDNPRNYGWYTDRNPFGNEYVDNPIKNGCACPTCNYHPGEDWNRTDSRDDNGFEPVYSISNGVVVRKEINTDAYGDTILIRYELSSEIDFSKYFLTGTIPVLKYKKSKYVVAQYMHISADSSINLGDKVFLGQKIGTIHDDYNHLHFEIMVDPDGNTKSTARNLCGYYVSQQSITDYGYIDPTKFIADFATTFSYDFSFTDSQGWQPSFSTKTIPQNQPDQGTWKVAAGDFNNVGYSNPQITSPSFPVGWLNTNQATTVKFSARVNGSGSSTEGLVCVDDGAVSPISLDHYHCVSIGLVPRDYQYHEYTADLSSLGTVPIVRLNIELTDNPHYEEWLFDWIKIYPSKWNFTNSWLGWSIRQGATFFDFYDNSYLRLDPTSKQPQFASYNIAGVPSQYSMIGIRYSVKKTSTADTVPAVPARIYFDTGTGFNSNCFSPSSIIRDGTNKSVYFSIPDCARNSKQILFDLFDSADFTGRQIAIDKIAFLKCDGTDDTIFSCDSVGGSDISVVGVGTVFGDATSRATGLRIIGPTTVNENSSTNFYAMLDYIDGSVSDVTKNVDWGKNCSVISISNGLLVTTALNYDEDCHIDAVYANMIAGKSITVKNVVTSELTLTDVIITGSAEVLENNGTQYRAVAYYSDGSQIDITESPNASWAHSCLYGRISAKGYFSIGEISLDQLCDIELYYQYKMYQLAGGVTVRNTTTNTPITPTIPPFRLNSSTTLSFESQNFYPSGSNTPQPEPINITTVFHSGDTVYSWVFLTEITKQLNLTWKYYRPNSTLWGTGQSTVPIGSSYTAVNSITLDNIQDSEYGQWRIEIYVTPANSETQQLPAANFAVQRVISNSANSSARPSKPTGLTVE
jgi:hypothetical protein